MKTVGFKIFYMVWSLTVSAWRTICSCLLVSLLLYELLLLPLTSPFSFQCFLYFPNELLTFETLSLRQLLRKSKLRCAVHIIQMCRKNTMHAKVLYGNLGPSKGSCFFPRNSLIPVKCLISLFLLYVSALCLCPQALKKTCKISPKIVKYIR